MRRCAHSDDAYRIAIGIAVIGSQGRRRDCRGQILGQNRPGVVRGHRLAIYGGWIEHDVNPVILPRKRACRERGVATVSVDAIAIGESSQWTARHIAREVVRADGVVAHIRVIGSDVSGVWRQRDRCGRKSQLCQPLAVSFVKVAFASKVPVLIQSSPGVGARILAALVVADPAYGTGHRALKPDTQFNRACIRDVDDIGSLPNPRRA